MDDVFWDWGPCDTNPVCEVEVDAKTVSTYRDQKKRLTDISNRMEDVRTMTSRISSEWAALRASLVSFVTRLELNDVGLTRVERLDQSVDAAIVHRGTACDEELRRLQPERDALAREVETMHAALLSVSREFNDLIKSCPVCYERHVDRCMVQCGHTLCSECVTKVLLQDSRCPVCRVPCSTIIPIYLG
jgi:hypothetical protein